ncbi:vWA domain-containing protein [Anaerotignum sp.]|uniref:vWA domain-containing protein n=1 Tax=Anaerotignum sp. TaxID=2039241 RepID=UPI0028A5CFBE|nr:BatA and WFA domain-containing protein [Anaerotignum sp.]
MRFFTPWGLLALLAVPIIILMYLLKQKYRETKVPSLYLWKKAIPESKAQEPWQKLRKNLLMFLQIAAALLLAFALGGPYIMGKSQVVDYVLALDCSMSMQATDVSESRFLAAKKDMMRMVEEAAPQTSFSMVLLQEEPALVLSGANEKKEVLRCIQEIEVTDGGVDWDKAKTILEAEKDVLGGEIVVFSDDYGSFGDLQLQEQIYNKAGNNSALSLLSYTEQEDGLSVLTRLENWGIGGEEKTVSLYVDDTVFDTKSFVLERGESVDVTFRGVPKETHSIMARLFPEDALQADNLRYEGVSSANSEKVLLVTESNLFLEKAMSLIDQVELYKATPEKAKELSGYGLYIFDGFLPEMLPKDGFIMLFNPPTNDYVTLGAEKSINGTARILDNTGLSDISSISFEVAQGKPIQSSWGKPLVRAENDTLAVFGEYEGRKMAVFGFDLHDSDLPLTAGFPILLYRLVEWYFPQGEAGLTQQQAGQVISFALRPETEKAWVVTPQDEKITVAPPFPATPFSQTKKMGFYSLVEEDGNGNQTTKTFGVNPKTQGESDLTLRGEQTVTEGTTAKTIGVGKPLRNILLLLLCIVLMIEWWVNCRER